jgi:nucleoid DNA-binding protein
MKKSDLVDAISDKTGVAKAQAQSIIEDVFELISDALS